MWLTGAQLSCVLCHVPTCCSRVLRMLSCTNTLTNVIFRLCCSPFISQNGCVVCMETELQLVQLGEASTTA